MLMNPEIINDRQPAKLARCFHIFKQCGRGIEQRNSSNAALA